MRWKTWIVAIVLFVGGASEVCAQSPQPSFGPLVNSADPSAALMRRPDVDGLMRRRTNETALSNQSRLSALSQIKKFLGFGPTPTPTIKPVMPGTQPIIYRFPVQPQLPITPR